MPQPLSITLQSLIDRSGRSQRAIERAAGLGNGTLSRYLGGKRTAMDTSTAARIADALECSVDWLLGREAAIVPDRRGPDLRRPGRGLHAPASGGGRHARHAGRRPDRRGQPMTRAPFTRRELAATAAFVLLLAELLAAWCAS